MSTNDIEHCCKRITSACKILPSGMRIKRLEDNIWPPHKMMYLLASVSTAYKMVYRLHVSVSTAYNIIKCFCKYIYYFQNSIPPSCKYISRLQNGILPPYKRIYCLQNGRPSLCKRIHRLQMVDHLLVSVSTA